VKVEVDHCQVQDRKFEDFLKSATILAGIIQQSVGGCQRKEIFCRQPMPTPLSLHAGVGSSKMKRDRLEALAASIRSPPVIQWDRPAGHVWR